MSLEWDEVVKLLKKRKRITIVISIIVLLNVAWSIYRIANGYYSFAIANLVVDALTIKVLIDYNRLGAFDITIKKEEDSE